MAHLTEIQTDGRVVYVDLSAVVEVEATQEKAEGRADNRVYLRLPNGTTHVVDGEVAEWVERVDKSK